MKSEEAWEKHFQENPEYEYPDTARQTFLAGWKAGRASAFAEAADIAERDAMQTTMRYIDMPLVQKTGSRIGFNIRAAAQRSEK